MIQINKDKLKKLINKNYGGFGSMIVFSEKIGTTSDNLSRILRRGTVKEDFMKKILKEFNKGILVYGDTIKPLPRIKEEDII